jgi:cyclic beta-1,2-glucan synthetase
VPKLWRHFGITFRYHSTTYEVLVENPSGVSRGIASLELDGHPIVQGSCIALVDDGDTHNIRLVLG